MGIIRVSVQCPNCHGTGRTYDLFDSAFGTTETIQVMCCHCEGDGYTLEEEYEPEFDGAFEFDPNERFEEEDEWDQEGFNEFYETSDAEFGHHPDGCKCRGCSPHLHRSY